MTVRTGRRPGLVGVLAAALLAALALAGCAAPEKASNLQTGGAGEGPVTRDEGGVAAAPEPRGPGGEQQAPTRIEPQQRSIIYTGSITVRVDNVEEAADRAGDIAVASGGLVGADQRTLNNESSRAQLTLRVPADRFKATLTALAGLGEEESRNIDTQDVTETVLDLDARIVSQQASVDRVRALLARAQTIGEVVSVESELTRREADLASLKTRRDRLADLVALSTITVILLGPAAAVPEEAKTGFLAGLEAGWESFLASVKLVLTVSGFLLPWLVAIGLPVWLLIWLVRRRRPALAPSIPAVPTGYGLPATPAAPAPTPPAPPTPTPPAPTPPAAAPHDGPTA